MPTPAFAALGGVARRGIYDNMKTAVDRVRQGQGARGEPALHARCARTTCSMPTSATSPRAGRRGSSRRTCRTAGGGSGWMRGTALQHLDELNAWLGERCRALWAEVRHPEHKGFSVAEMLELERGAPDAHAGALRRLRAGVQPRQQHLPGDGGAQPLLGAVRVARHMVSTRLYPGAGGGRGRGAHRGRARAAERARARRCTTGSTTSRCCRGSLGRCATARRSWTCPSRWPGCARRCCARRRATGSWRRCWRWCPAAGLDAVLVAAELALEHAGPSGRVSPEHVANVLARLTRRRRPENVATALQR
jgi:hypothetical protein